MVNFNFESLGFSASGISLFATLFIVYTIIVSVIALGLYFVQAIGIYNMSISAGIKCPWMSFVPVLKSFTFGKLAEKYKKRDGTEAMKFGIVLAVLEGFILLITVVCMILSINSIIEIIFYADKAMQNDTAMTISMFSSLIPVIIISLIIGVAGLAYAIIRYIALWRIFSAFDYQNATLFTVLAVFFNFLQPIFLFVLRKNTPAFEYSQRIGIFTNN